MRLLNTKAATNPYWPAWMPPEIKYHLLKKPHVGGTPIMERAPATSPVMVYGIFRNIPLRSSKAYPLTLYTILPTAKKTQRVMRASLAI